jgi:mRNA interferase HigB
LEFNTCIQNYIVFLHPNALAMRIVAIKAITEYVKVHSNANVPLREWYKKTKQVEWTCLADIKQIFNSVDFVGNNRYVFNIKGNDYELVAIVIFSSKKVYIRFIGTHNEYDKIDCSNI